MSGRMTGSQSGASLGATFDDAGRAPGRSGRHPPSLLERSSRPSVTGFLGLDGHSPLAWDDTWPRVVERVTRVLRRRGAPPTAIDDAVQTAALRALCRREGFDSFDGLVSWVIVVAWHEVQAEWRHNARADLGEVPERPVGPDPASVVESHIEIDAVANGLSSLSNAEREAILSPLVDGRAPDRPYDAQAKMRRYRARRHLAELIERADR